MLYKQVLGKLVEKRNRKLSGEITGIPFPFERFKPYIPELERGAYIGFLGASGAAKSKLTRFMCVYSVLDFAFANNYPIKILYFALEDPKEKIFMNLMAHYLLVRHGFKTNLWELESKGDFVFPPEAERLLKKDEDFYNWVHEHLWIIDDCLTPNEIHEKCLAVNSRLKNNEHVLMIVDNYANIIPDDEDKGDDWKAVRRFSRNIVRTELCKQYDFTVFAVLQQDLDTERYIFRSVAAGKSSAGSIEPSASSIGDVKIIIRDFYYAIGLINPWKYEITHYPNSKGYNIDILRNKVRFLNIFKTNEGEIGGRLGLLFGHAENFTELPSLEDAEALDRVYRNVLEEEQEKKNKYLQKKLF